MLRAATGANLAGKSHAMKLRAALLIACTSLAMSIWLQRLQGAPARFLSHKVC
jgi:hypothetical protein